MAVQMQFIQMQFIQMLFVEVYLSQDDLTKVASMNDSEKSIWLFEESF